MFHSAKIVQKYMASPTVAVLKLHAPTLASFAPGQWVDFVVEPHDWIGGFSIASSPKDLPDVTIAVKRSDHPPATWVHDKSSLHDSVKISVGGICILEEEGTTNEASSGPQHPRAPAHIFFAGGIGISPILSQYREFLHRRASRTEDQPKSPSMFLYSVSAPNEELVDLARPGCNAGIDKLMFTVTKADGWGENWYDRATMKDKSYDHVAFRTGRVLTEFLNGAPIDSIFYICGPPSMIDYSVHHLAIRGIPMDRINYEKWW